MNTSSNPVGRVPSHGASPKGAKEMSRLPNSWRFARVGDILKVRNGYLEGYQVDYRSSLGAAERQWRRQEIWGDWYGAPPVFQGGRADGNS